MRRLLMGVLGIVFAGFSFAAEPPKLEHLLRGVTTKSEVHDRLKNDYRIDKQDTDRWLIYRLGGDRRRPDAIVEFKDNKVSQTTHFGGAEAVSTNRETIEFVETLYSLLESQHRKGDSTATLALTSFKLRNDVERKIIELRFKDRIISFHLWREPGDYESAALDVINPEDSFFQ